MPLELMATFLLSMAMLGTQIAWTRLFSFMIWYHFAFLVISTAMLGFAVGGLLLNLRPALMERRTGDFLFACIFAFCLLIATALLIVCNLPFDGGVLDSPKNFGLFVVLIGLVASGFLFAGLFISYIIAKNPSRVARIYAANMVGSGAGCVMSVYLLEHLLPASAVLSFSLLACIALLVITPLTAKRGRALLLSVVAFVVILPSFLRSLDPLAEPFYMKSTKPFPALSKDRILSRESNSLATLDLFRADNLTGLWGLSDKNYFWDHPGRPFPDIVGFLIDGWAMTFAYQAKGDITEEPVFDYLPSAIAYEFLQARSALVIGSGGGIDLISARRRGVRSITAVEINSIIMNKVLGELSQASGRIFHQKGVRPVIAEGRSFITAAGSRRWDVIQLSGVDTLAASQAGAFTLAESYLYTREAFRGYLEHLNPGGVLTLTRWMFDPPRHSLRVITVADAALRELGVGNTASHIALVADCRLRFGVFLISLSPFTREHSEDILRICTEKGFIPLYIPHFRSGPTPNTYERLIYSRDRNKFISEYPFDISVTTDDKPFFFEHSKWQDVWKYPDYILNRFNGHLILIVTAILVALLGTVFILIPARYGLTPATREPGHRCKLIYFSSLGLGYILVEMVLVQKLTLYLGNPVFALALVLCAMLICSGLGSLISPLVIRRGHRAVVGVVGAVALLLIGYRLGLDGLLHATLALPLAARIAVTLLTLSLVATLMGIPFPAAVAQIGERRRALLVHGWVLNSYFSVLGACVAMLISISFGFGAVLLTGAAIYALAALMWYVAEALTGDNPG